MNGIRLSNHPSKMDNLREINVYARLVLLYLEKQFESLTWTSEMAGEVKAVLREFNKDCLPTLKQYHANSSVSIQERHAKREFRDVLRNVRFYAELLEIRSDLQK